MNFRRGMSATGSPSRWRAEAYDVRVPVFRALAALFGLCAVMWGQVYSAPAGVRPAQRGAIASILPGGRIITPLGIQYFTGPSPFGMALSSTGRTLVTANLGPGTA